MPVVQARRALLGQRRSRVFYLILGLVWMLLALAASALSSFAHGKVITGSWTGIFVLSVGVGLVIGGYSYFANERVGADATLSADGVVTKRFEYFALTAAVFR